MIVLKLQPPEFFRWFFLNRKKGDKNMKSKIIITGAILCAITTTAHAVTKCVALNSNTTCPPSTSSYIGHTDWAATCTTNGVSIPISGIGICSSLRGSSIGQTATELNTSSTSDDNKYCWCKMTSPAVSRWVLHNPNASTSCDRYCANFCANDVQSRASFRSAMFGSLSD